MDHQGDCRKQRIASPDTASPHSGRGQLTLVEHALCPLAGVRNGSLSHHSEFQFVDQSGRRQKALATVTAAFGLLPRDEFILWGLLGLTLDQPEEVSELLATPHFILRRLGVIDSALDRGGSAYRTFRESLKRLAGVVYHCDGFYDPMRREHRSTTFGLLSYSLPVDPSSSRAWRIVWDPIFLEFCNHARGSLAFDFSVYRSLDPASRRLYLFLSKIFWRREWTHWVDVRTLAVNVLGFASTIAMRNLKQKVKRSILRLVSAGVIRPMGSSVEDIYVERDGGGSLVRFRRGPLLQKRSSRRSIADVKELVIYDPLRAIGLDDESIAGVSRRFKPGLIQQWADITLAAKEKHGSKFFKKSPQAFFMDSLQHASESGRTPPDWWWAWRKERQQSSSPLATRLVELTRKPATATDADFVQFLKGAGRAELEALTHQTVSELQRSGMPAHEAARRATEICVAHLRTRFNRDPAA